MLALHKDIKSHLIVYFDYYKHSYEQHNKLLNFGKLWQFLEIKTYGKSLYYK